MTVHLDTNDVADLVRRRASGEGIKLLESRYGVSNSVIYRYLRANGNPKPDRRTVDGLPAIDIPALLRDRERGLSFNVLAKTYATTPTYIAKTLTQHGDPYKPKKWDNSWDGAVITAYSGGESELSLARRFGFSRSVITGVLTKNGVHRRGRRDAQEIRYERSTPAQRKALTAAANAAMRGATVPWEKRIKDALGRQRSTCFASELENVITMELRARGLAVEQQTAVGPYNCDLTIAASSVAVEVFGGGWHWSGSHAANHRERSRYILDQGWHLVCFVVDLKRPLIPAGYDYLITFCELAQRNPSARREYRVVGGTGQELPRISPHLNPLTNVGPDE